MDDLAETMEAKYNKLNMAQRDFVDAHALCSGHDLCIMERLRVNVQKYNVILKSKPLNEVISYNAKSYAEYVPPSKNERMKLLWQIAKKGTRPIYDREGNHVMMNPTASISAVRSLNEMLPDSLAPKQINVDVKIEDKRTEQEIADNVKALMARYNELSADAPRAELPIAIENNNDIVITDV